MVKKLIKYDFRSFLRILLPVQLILLGIAVVNRLIQLFEKSDNKGVDTVYNISFTSSVILYVVAVAVLLVMTIVVSVVRFYQGMYSHEGYLNHTLPVTPNQHILSKLIVSYLFKLGTYVAILLSVGIVCFGEMDIELFKAGSYLIKEFFDAQHAMGVVYILEMLVLLFAADIMQILMLFFCVSVGQLVSKLKILLAFGVYFALYTLGQVFSTVVIIIFSVLPPNLLEEIGKWINAHPDSFYHIVMCSAIVLEVLLCIVFYGITRRIMRKKLNLA